MGSGERHALAGLLRAAGHAVPLNPLTDRLYKVLVPALGLYPSETVVTLSGNRRMRVFRSRPRTLEDNPDFHIYYFGTYEGRLSRALTRLVRRGDVCFDVGANIGWYTILLSSLVGRHGQVHAFEPDPQLFRQLTDNVSLNNEAQHVYLNEAGAGRFDGQATLYRDLDNSLNNSLYALGFENVVEHRVVVERLDTYAAERSLARVDFIKVDVEGSEFDILRGAEHLLSQTGGGPIVQLEVNPWTARAAGYRVEDMLAWLRDEFGYALYGASHTGRLSKLPWREEWSFSNVFCIPPSAALERRLA